MSALVNRPFANVFNFSRSITAPYRNANGALITAPVDTPRFDHDEAGNRLGLLIARGPARGQHDALSVVSGDWEIVGKATVMVEWLEEGVIRRRALYTRSVRAEVNFCLMIMGHLRSIGAVPGYLPNVGAVEGQIGGYVRFANKDWPLGLAFDAGDSFVLGDGSGRVIIESA